MINQKYIKILLNMINFSYSERISSYKIFEKLLKKNLLYDKNFNISRDEILSLNNSFQEKPIKQYKENNYYKIEKKINNKAY